jgi:hypothetical protein
MEVAALSRQRLKDGDGIPIVTGLAAFEAAAEDALELRGALCPEAVEP